MAPYRQLLCDTIIYCGWAGAIIALHTHDRSSLSRFPVPTPLSIALFHAASLIIRILHLDMATHSLSIKERMGGSDANRKVGL